MAQNNTRVNPSGMHQYWVALRLQKMHSSHQKRSSNRWSLKIGLLSSLAFPHACTYQLTNYAQTYVWVRRTSAPSLEATPTCKWLQCSQTLRVVANIQEVGGVLRGWCGRGEAPTQILRLQISTWRCCRHSGTVSSESIPGFERVKN